MQTQQVVINSSADWARLDALVPLAPHWVLVFADRTFFAGTALVDALSSRFPQAVRMACSTSGEVTPAGVQEGSCTVTAVRFDDTRLRTTSMEVAGLGDERAAGQQLAHALQAPDLRAVMLLSPGVAMNGSALVAGMSGVLGVDIPITGGMAGDSAAFVQTWTLLDGVVSDRQVLAVGLYGQRLKIGHGCYGGWVPFGPLRTVTRVASNVLYELDGEPALDVYKRYLGDYVKGLPATALLFPFAVQNTEGQDEGLIRTILGVNEADGSLTLAGEVRKGGQLKLMQASSDRLIDGAEAAASSAHGMLAGHQPGLAILVSCVGRKLVMGARVDEEVDAVAGVLGPNMTLTGFYSSGEFCPTSAGRACDLHNQTMTVTVLCED